MLPAKLIIMIGLLPYLSESDPQTGVNKNCIKEKTPAMNPIIDSLMWSSLTENDGSNGMMIPNPSRSINIVRKIITRAGLFFNI